MTRRMADSANIAYIDPSTIDMLGYYVDGNYVPSQAELARFAGKVMVPISVNPGGNVGIVGDGPPDNGTWPAWVSWVARRRASGADPTIYTNLSSWTEAVAAFNNAGVPQPHWWIAQWNDNPVMIPGAVAHQYQTVPNRYDLSIVDDVWPGIDTGAPATGGVTAPPSTAPSGGAGPAYNPYADPSEDVMLLVYNPGDGSIYLLSGALYAPILDIPDRDAFANAGVKQITVTQGQHQALQQASNLLSGKLAGTLNVSGALTAS